MNNDPIDNLAQSFLIGLVICSTISDGYIMLKNYMNDKETQKNVEYYTDVMSAVSSVVFNKCEKKDDGTIIIEQNEIETKIEQNESSKKEINENENIINELSKNEINENENIINKSSQNEMNENENIINESSQNEMNENIKLEQNEFEELEKKKREEEIKKQKKREKRLKEKEEYEKLMKQKEEYEKMLKEKEEYEKNKKKNMKK